MVEGDIRGGLKDIGNYLFNYLPLTDRELDILNTLLLSNEKNANTSIQQAECTKKRNQYNEFVNQKNDLNTRFQDSVT
jgi:hypothetical protein